MGEEKKIEVKPGEISKTDDFNYKRDSVKTLRQVAKESADRVKKENDKSEVDKTPKPEVEKKPEETKEVEIKKEEPKVDVGEIAKKAAEEAATKVATETKEAFKTEITKILDKDKDILEKQKEADALIASWEKEKRLPKDYKELISETQRITEAKWEQKAKAEREVKEKERLELETKEKANKEDLAKKSEAERQAQFNRQIAQDLDELYAAKLLPRPTKLEEVNNEKTTDEAAKATQKILQFGIELNTKLAKEGKPPVTSLTKIFFLHYQPYIKTNPLKTQVAGADAPVMGAANTPTGDTNKKGYIYARDHNKSFRDIGREIVRKIRGQ